MSIRSVVFNRLQWVNFPSLLLISLLQRSPMLRVVGSAFEAFFQSGPGSVLKSAVAAAAALGAIDTLAGATLLVATKNSPLAAPVGSPVNIAFGVSGTQTAPLSWTISGTIPTGLAFYTVSTGGTGMTTTGTINAGTLYMRGTPTTEGSFEVDLRAWQGANATLIESPLFAYTVNVTAATVGAPSITTQPADLTVNVGSSASFSVVATGTAPLTYQWQKGSTTIVGATGATYTLASVQAVDAGSYSVMVSNPGGSVTSSAATLTVNASAGSGVVLTQQPQSTTAPAGSTVTFTVVAATSATTPIYQWQKNGANISGATTSSLTLSGISATDAADYTVVVTEGANTSTSRLARLVVATPDQGRIINMSVRGIAGFNGQPLIVGFVMSGGSKSVLVRAIGPGLIPFGVPSTMADPTLELHGSVNGADAVLASNDNWGDNGGAAAMSAVFASAGAFPLSGTTSKDAALAASIDGPRTALVNSKDGSSGVVLVEGYDAGSGNAQHFINISARNQVGTGGNILIAGFVINGNVPKKVLIRGVGPKLTDYGVTGVLIDPKLEVHTTINNQDVIVAANDNWNDEPGVPAATTAAGAFVLNNGSKDAVVSVTLPAGIYTAQVSGVNSTTGNALLEVYEVP